jgi:hypothetical protein
MGGCLVAMAQTPPANYQSVETPSIRKPFDKKLNWGITYNQLWSSIEGSQPAATYFTKPSIGFLLSVEYFPKSFLGITAGAGYQQRGAGISNPNKIPVTGLAPDSSFRERLRFNTIELPIGIILRTPKDVVKGLRLSVSGSIIPMINVKTMDTFNELEAGIRNVSIYKDVSSLYFKNDLAYQITFGPEIDSGGSGLFRVHFLYSKGTTNVYSNGQGNAVNHTLGVRISWLFGHSSNSITQK